VTDREYLAFLHTLRCVVHLNCYSLNRNATQAHHLEFVRGGHSAFATAPLCDDCHEAMHEHRRRAFYLAHKLSDCKLLAWTIKEVVHALEDPELSRA